MGEGSKKNQTNNKVHRLCSIWSRTESVLTTGYLVLSPGSTLIPQWAGKQIISFFLPQILSVWFAKNFVLPSWSVPYESLPFHDFSSCGTRRFPDQESTVNTPCKSNQFFSVWTWIRDCVLPSSCPSSAETSGTSHWLLTAPLVGYEPGSLMTSQTSGESWKAPQDSEGLHEHPGQQK